MQSPSGAPAELSSVETAVATARHELASLLATLTETLKHVSVRHDPFYRRSPAMRTASISCLA
jgi:hypothetical protein